MTSGKTNPAVTTVATANPFLSGAVPPAIPTTLSSSWSVPTTTSYSRTVSPLGLSASAKAGVGSGIGIGIVVMSLLAYICFRNFKKRVRLQGQDVVAPEPTQKPEGGGEPAGAFPTMAELEDPGYLQAEIQSAGPGGSAALVDSPRQAELAAELDGSHVAMGPGKSGMAEACLFVIQARPLQ
ncbi:hypothetical protein VMCG_02814 [Cytospora schulzeri]|uniref:Uncharacterized protein n=1 Tax=Cytospora schulzeri TaxID=448051 RepID=A0A423WZZ5_9PEZI|nr:hypothetical protein VMCG_02814 [Valsa malicola]